MLSRGQAWCPLCSFPDAIVHTTLHAVLAGLRPDLMEAPGYPRFRDVYALQEGLCDMSALLLHFSYREAVLDTIRHTAGAIYPAWTRTSRPPSSDRCCRQNSLPGIRRRSWVRRFREGLGMDGGIRNALGSAPDPAAFNRANEPHERGAFLVAGARPSPSSRSCVRRTLELFAIYRVGGGRIDGDMPGPPGGAPVHRGGGHRGAHVHHLRPRAGLLSRGSGDVWRFSPRLHYG